MSAYTVVGMGLAVLPTLQVGHVRNYFTVIYVSGWSSSNGLDTGLPAELDWELGPATRTPR